MIASASNSIKLHELPSGNVVHHYDPVRKNSGPIRSLSWNKDGFWLGLVPHSGYPEIISIKDNLKLLHTIKNVDKPSCLAFQNTTSKSVALGTEDGHLMIYDVKSKNVKKTFPCAGSAIRKISFTSKDNFIITGCDSGEALIYNNTQNTLSGKFKVPRSTTLSALKTSPLKNNHVVAGSNEGVIVVWDLYQNKQILMMGSHQAPVTDVSFSPTNSDFIVSTGLDRQVCFYATQEKKCIANFFVESSMKSVDFSPDGNLVVMGSHKGHIYIYDCKKLRQPLYTISGHTSEIIHLSYRKNQDSEVVEVMSPSYDCETSTPKNNHLFRFTTRTCSIGAGDSDMSEASPVSVDDSFLAAAGFARHNTIDDSPLIGDTNLQIKSTCDSSDQIMSTPFIPPNLSEIKIFQQLSSRQNDSDKPSLPTITSLKEKASEEGIEKLITDSFRFLRDELDKRAEQQECNMLMSLAKQKIAMEEKFQNIEVILASNHSQNASSVLEENMALKRKIAMLEHEIEMLKMNYNNNN